MASPSARATGASGLTRRTTTPSGYSLCRAQSARTSAGRPSSRERRETVSPSAACTSARNPSLGRSESSISSTLRSFGRPTLSRRWAQLFALFGGSTNWTRARRQPSSCRARTRWAPSRTRQQSPCEETMTGLRCSPSASMRALRRRRRSSSWASWRIRFSSPTRRRSLSEGIKPLAPRDPLVVDVSAASAPEEVEQDEPAEEEDRQDGEEPYDAQHEEECVQSSLAFPWVRSRCEESGRPDLNRRPLGPQPSALPDCATSRRVCDQTWIIPDETHAIMRSPCRWLHPTYAQSPRAGSPQRTRRWPLLLPTPPRTVTTSWPTTKTSMPLATCSTTDPVSSRL